MTLEEADWNPTIVREVDPEAIAALKAQPGGDLAVALPGHRPPGRGDRGVNVARCQAGRVRWCPGGLSRSRRGPRRARRCA